MKLVKRIFFTATPHGVFSKLSNSDYNKLASSFNRVRKSKCSTVPRSPYRQITSVRYFSDDA